MSLTPGKAHCPGSTQGSLAGTLTRLFQASTSPGSWQRPEVGAPGGWRGRGSRQPAGNGKARTSVMVGLQHSSVDVNNRGGICDLLPKMLEFPVATLEHILGPLLESSCCHCSTLAASKTPNPSASDTFVNLVIPLLAAPSRPEAYLALVPSMPLLPAQCRS